MEQVTIPRQISTTAIKRTPSSQLTKLKFSPNRNEVQTKVKTVVTPAKVISETQQVHGIFASLHVKMDERHCVLKQLHKEIQTKEKISEELREEIKLRSTENAKQEALLVNTQTRVNDITGSMEYMSLDNVLTEANEEEAELNKYYDEFEQHLAEAYYELDTIESKFAEARKLADSTARGIDYQKKTVQLCEAEKLNLRYKSKQLEEELAAAELFLQQETKDIQDISDRYHELNNIFLMSGEDISTNEILIHEVGLVAREKEFEVKEIKTEIAESRTRLAIQCEHHERQILELENSLTDSKSAVASIQIEIDSLDDAELKSTIETLSNEILEKRQQKSDLLNEQLKFTEDTLAIQLEAASQRETLRNIREELHQVKQETNDNEKMLAEENRTQQQITTANDMINFDIEASQAMLLETITAITKAEEELRMRIDINSAKDEAINNLEQQQSLIRKELIEVTESAKLFWEEKDGLNGKLNEQRLMNRVLNDSLLLQQEQADAEKAQQILLMDSLQKELDTMEESLKEKHAILSSLQEKLLQQERIASTESENDGFAEMTKEVDEHYQPLIQSMTTKLQKLKEDNGEKAFIKIKGKIKDLELAITAKKERLAELNRVKSSNQVIETKVVLDSTGSPLKHSTTSQEPICQSITYLECKTLSKSQLLERDIITSREIERLSLSQIGEERRSSDEQDISPQKSNLRNFIRSSFLSQESYHVESIRKKSIVAEESERRRAEDERRKKRTLDPSRKGAWVSTSTFNQIEKEQQKSLEQRQKLKDSFKPKGKKTSTLKETKKSNKRSYGSSANVEADWFNDNNIL